MIVINKILFYNFYKNSFSTSHDSEIYTHINSLLIRFCLYPWLVAIFQLIFNVLCCLNFAGSVGSKCFVHLTVEILFKKIAHTKTHHSIAGEMWRKSIFFGTVKLQARSIKVSAYCVYKSDKHHLQQLLLEVKEELASPSGIITTKGRTYLMTASIFR